MWAGPKVVYSRFSTAMRLSIPGGRSRISPPSTANTFYYGGQGGVAFGYRYIFFAVELTMAQMFGSAAVTSAPAGIARAADLSGLVIYPAFGLMGEF